MTRIDTGIFGGPERTCGKRKAARRRAAFDNETGYFLVVHVGAVAAGTAAAVEAFLGGGYLDNLLGRIWRFRAGIFV